MLDNVEDPRSPYTGDESGREQSKEERSFKKGLERLLRSTHAYAEAGRAFAKATATLGNDLQDFSGIESISGQQLSSHVSPVAHLMRTLSASQEKTMVNVLDALDVPMFQLLELEAQELRHLSEARSRAEDVATKQKKKGGLERFEGENAAIDRSVSQARCDLESQATILTASRNIKVCRYLRSLVASEEEFFAMGNHGMKELSPHLEKMDSYLNELEASHIKRGVRDGYVWKLSHSLGKWKRVWLVLRYGTLEMRSDSGKKEGKRPSGRSMNLLISTVRVPMIKPGRDADDSLGPDRFEFEIVSPERKRGWMFAAKSEAERAEWIEALQASIGSLINNQQLTAEDGGVGSGGGGAGSGGAGGINGSGSIDVMRKSNRNPGKEGLGRVIRKVIPGKGHRKTRSVTSAETARAMAMSLMSEGGESSVMAELSAVSGNSKCVDCGKNDPDWASMNLGVLFCLNCSGVHRHLGSHISKVRSLTMDKWPDGTVRYMKCIGNERANKFWEFGLSADSETCRLTPSSTQQERTDFITQKYAKRAFAQAQPDEYKTRADLNASMFKFIHDVSLIVELSSEASSAANTPVSTPSQRRKESTDEPSSSASDAMEPSGLVRPVRTYSVDEPLMPEKRAHSGGSSPAAGKDGPLHRSSSPTRGPLTNELLRQSLGDDSLFVQKPTLMPVELVKELLWPLYELMGWGAEITAVEPGSGKSLAQVLLDKRDPWLLHVFIVQGLEVGLVREGSGETVLHYCARHNLFECLEIVLAQWGGSIGPALHATNGKGQTPIDVAKTCQSFRVLELFVLRDDRETVRLRELEDSNSPMRLSGISGGGGGDGEERKSPRGKFGSNQTATTGDLLGEGMQKFLNKKKTGGGHLRSKSVFERPTSTQGSTVRDSTSKIPTFTKKLGTKRQGNGVLGSRPSSTSSPQEAPTRGVQEEEMVSPESPATTPMRASKDRPTLGEEVVAREGKNPLMKGKGLDVDLIKEMRADTTLSLGATETLARENHEEKDLLGMLSADSGEDSSEERHSALI